MHGIARWDIERNISSGEIEHDESRRIVQFPMDREDRLTFWVNESERAVYLFHHQISQAQLKQSLLSDLKLRTSTGCSFRNLSAPRQNDLTLPGSSICDSTLHALKSGLMRIHGLEDEENPPLGVLALHCTGVRALSRALSCKPARMSDMSGFGVRCEI